MCIRDRERGGSAGKVADNQRLTPLNVSLQNLHCREAVVPLFFPRSIVDMAETHSEDVLGTKTTTTPTSDEDVCEDSLSLWDKLLQGIERDEDHNPLMVFIGMYSSRSFHHDKMDQSKLQKETMKYYPMSKKDRNMQCTKSENHMCLTLGLEKLIPPPPKESVKQR